MNQYNIILSTSESTVVAEYQPQGSRSDAYQSEAALEQAFNVLDTVEEFSRY